MGGIREFSGSAVEKSLHTRFCENLPCRNGVSSKHFSIVCCEINFWIRCHVFCTIKFVPQMPSNLYHLTVPIFSPTSVEYFILFSTYQYYCYQSTLFTIDSENIRFADIWHTISWRVGQRSNAYRTGEKKLCGGVRDGNPTLAAVTDFMLL